MSYNRKAGLYFGVKHESAGSEGGFQPASFRSSRADRRGRDSSSTKGPDDNDDRTARDQKRVRLVRDYMDEDDGLLGGALTTRRDRDAFGPTVAADSLGGFVFQQLGLEQQPRPGDVGGLERLLSQLVAVPTNSVGKRLLRQLGWRDGQGIGPRVALSASAATAADAVAAAVPAQSLRDGLVTVAPKEPDLLTGPLGSAAAAFAFAAGQQSDRHTGLGFRHSDRLRSSAVPTDDIRRRNGHDDAAVGGYHDGEAMVGFKSRVQSHKRAFAAAVEDDDYDNDDEDIAYDCPLTSPAAAARFDYEVYDDDEHDNYHDEDITSNRNDTLRHHKQQEEREQTFARRLVRCGTDQRAPLRGFCVSTRTPQLIQTCSAAATAASPLSPDDFRPLHRFATAVVVTTAAAAAASTTSSDSVAAPQSLKVFELMRPADRLRVEKLIQSVKERTKDQERERQQEASATTIAPLPPLPPLPVTPPPPPPPPLLTTTATTATTGGERPLLVSSAVMNSSSFVSLARQFQSRFAPATDLSLPKARPDEQSAAEGLTSADVLAAQLRRDQQREREQQLTRTQSQAQDTHPQLRPVVRVTTVWAPSSLLCKRFGVPVPDPALSVQLATSTTLGTAPTLATKGM
jgi:hypothetical protein